jgi:glycosyltransferase involved in cell wall biosynthesis
MGDPYISICIPAYKRTNYLKRLLDSIVLQNFKNFEVIVSDDSNDDSVINLIKDYNDTIKIIYFHNSPSLRTPGNMNFAISKAKGEWIKIIHDDDWLSNENSLQIFADATKTVRQFIFSAYNNFIEKDSRFQLVQFPISLKSKIIAAPLLLISNNMIGPPSVSMFHKSVLVKYDTRLNWRVDQEYYIRIIQLLKDFEYINQPLINVGVSESQVTNACINVPSVEIPEGYILLEKYGTSPLKNIIVFDAWWRILRNCQIRSEKELTQFGNTLWPACILSMVHLQSKFSSVLLKNGFVSKTLMTLSYVQNIIQGKL